MSELKAEYVSDDVRRLNPDVFADDSEMPLTADAPTPEERFIILWEMLTRIPLQREYVFYPGRRWRFDFAHVATRIAVEVNGGVWISGRHNRGQGYINDCEKMFHAAELGWRVFPLTPEQITVDNVQTIARTIQTGGSW